MHVLLADELIEALRDVTPPYDEEEEIDEDRAREVQARRELEDDGCPPCYPPDLDFPLLHPPTSVEAIVRYWQFPFGTNSLVLCAQRSDWEGFRAFHRWMRQRHRTIFGAYEDKTRKRRARHGLRGSFCLLPEAERQNRRENWVEFQAYQLGRLEKMERERDALEHNLDEAQQKAQDGDAAVSKRGEEDADAYLHMLRVSKRDMDRHEVLLQWIEQRRLDMDRADAKTSGAEEAGDGARRKPVEGTDARVLRARQPKTPPVLGKARVSKAKKRPNAQRRSPHRNCYGYEVWAGIKTAKQMGSQRHGREIEAVGS